jgi:hypothetical protein
MIELNTYTFSWIKRGEEVIGIAEETIKQTGKVLVNPRYVIEVSRTSNDKNIVFFTVILDSLNGKTRITTDYAGYMELKRS